MKSPRDHALALLRKAANDLIAADTVLSTEQAMDTVCFHAHQAVEKSLKAVLAFHNVEYPWHHDLGELFALVKPFVPEMMPFEEQIVGLTPYAVAVRYDDEFEPCLSEAAQALETATAAYQLVCKMIEPDEANSENKDVLA